MTGIRFISHYPTDYKRVAIHVIIILLYLQLQPNTQVFQMLMQPPNLTESTSQSLMIIDSDSVYQILFTFKIELSRDANIANVSSSFSATLAPNVTINESSIALDSLGYKGFFPSG